ALLTAEQVGDHRIDRAANDGKRRFSLCELAPAPLELFGLVRQPDRRLRSRVLTSGRGRLRRCSREAPAHDWKPCSPRRCACPGWVRLLPCPDSDDQPPAPDDEEQENGGEDDA